MLVLFICALFLNSFSGTNQLVLVFLYANIQSTLYNGPNLNLVEVTFRVLWLWNYWIYVYTNPLYIFRKIRIMRNKRFPGSIM